ncbi:hypothetical protein EXIGLDRAFT_640618 [Exidia glandulosa HHB12029]|uniref:Uncharacterized protein n=1 Tax=Exidia glandulosa HHB12029 TaxID=1314781 RepID=A0A165ML18_EXIGL|nr:hypothetical protein EXIGLDRAFT_640618 [Exidia glandulosa HHB12029]
MTRRNKTPKPSLDVWRSEVIMAELMRITAERSDAWCGSPDAPIEFDGPAGAKRPFRFQDPSYSWSLGLLPSEHVQARWEWYQRLHPNRPECSDRPIAIDEQYAIELARDFKAHYPYADCPVRLPDDATLAAPLVPEEDVEPEISAAADNDQMDVDAPADVPSDTESIADSSAGVGQKRKRKPGHHGAPSVRAKQRKRDEGRQGSRRRGRRGTKKKTLDGMSATLAQKILAATESLELPHVAHEDLATNGNPYTGPPPVSKKKVDYLNDFEWGPTADASGFPKSVQTLLDEGYRIMWNRPDRAQSITDKDGTVVVAKAKPIAGMRWQFIMESVEEQIGLLDARLTHPSARAADKGTKRTDGIFNHLTCGIGMGMGQTEPKYWNVRLEWHEPLREFLNHPDVKIWARHMSSTFKFFFPKLWGVYDELEQFLKQTSGGDLRGAFPGFPMLGITLNTGRRVACPMHVDFKNAIFGMCVIAAFGRFNHRKHGLLILKEFKMLVQVAPGDVIFIPSALLTHGNTELGEGEVRRSWTMFNAGGLFRFKDAGFRTMQDLRRTGGTESIKNFKSMFPDFLKYCMDSHMTLDELKKYHSVQ